MKQIEFKKGNWQKEACKNKKAPNKCSELLLMYPGTESNRHSHYCEQDFKSCVSTSSTTRVGKKNPVSDGKNFGAEDRARTGHLDLGKVALYQMSYFRIKKRTALFKRDCKNKVCNKALKNYLYLGL
jgi:hypothetical protein